MQVAELEEQALAQAQEHWIMATLKTMEAIPRIGIQGAGKSTFHQRHFFDSVDAP
ncbi:hypothetical protein [Noviherbaspirillum sedimenti]|uniref:hypothetical protein n=1 Tax=Noviherbaspirillum sedimenti TaxID=2320865 RepID=UPI0013146022|nr:hypothetical protein [Noviherbaspirillum sedimenti]